MTNPVNFENHRFTFEQHCFDYYQGIVAAGWSNPEEGDRSRESLFWRKPDGRYGVHAIEQAWTGFKWAVAAYVPALQALRDANDRALRDYSALHTEVKALREDKIALDWLDTKRHPLVENQSYGDPHGEHVSNIWHIEFPVGDVRTALHADRELVLKVGGAL